MSSQAYRKLTGVSLFTVTLGNMGWLWSPSVCGQAERPFLPRQPHTQPRLRPGRPPPAGLSPLPPARLHPALAVCLFCCIYSSPPEFSAPSHSLHAQRVRPCSLLVPTATPHWVMQTLSNSHPFKSLWLRILSKAFHQINRQKHTSPLSFKCLFSSSSTLPISPYLGCSVTLVTWKEKK